MTSLLLGSGKNPDSSVDLWHQPSGRWKGISLLPDGVEVQLPTRLVLTLRFGVPCHRPAELKVPALYLHSVTCSNPLHCLRWLLLTLSTSACLVLTWTSHWYNFLKGITSFIYSILMNSNLFLFLLERTLNLSSCWLEPFFLWTYSEKKDFRR